MEEKFFSALRKIAAPDRGDAAEGKARLDSLTKPPGSLGRLEELALALWRIQGRRPLAVDPARIYTVAGDHGVAARGVSPYPQEVTRQMVLNFLNNGAAINVFCRTAGVDQMVVDAGCAGDGFAPHPGLVSRRIKNGTDDFTKGPAMSRDDCLRCLLLGIELAENAASDGIACLGAGEMGIANTTAATALYCAYLDLMPEAIVGPGAGLAPERLRHKAGVVAAGLELHRNAVAGQEPLAVLAALGGLEIAVICGLVLGAAQARLPIVIDGFISTSAAVAALAMAPQAREFCIFSHGSAEPGHKTVLETLGISPLLDLRLRLGEGSGAALGIFLLRCAADMFNDMATFSQAGISGREQA